ncbi:hypothetical protein GRB31_20250 (plasmid) [Ralstonia solanacearum]|uniref:hypothetical protein n=1 Tax=Ralstonia solanacearum TaxID=305 RepID=UPI0006DBEB1B|nr:hypothetical protein [Ralstonia solanacearum]QHB57298.1 hypothetical protein GRB31_20250 [Ralstonia solanacearum]
MDAAAGLQARLFVADAESETLEQAASAREKIPPIPGREHHRRDLQSVTEPIVHPMRETGAGNLIGRLFRWSSDDREAPLSSDRLFGVQVIPVLNRTHCVHCVPGCVQAGQAAMRALSGRVAPRLRALRSCPFGVAW